MNSNGLSVPEYYNSIFWNNTGTLEDDQIYNEFDPAIVSNSIVQGGYEGENIIDADPQFVDEAELRIRSNSPAVNTGLNNVVVVEEDIAERPGIYVMSKYYLFYLPYTVSHTSTGDLEQSQKSDIERHLQINFNN